MSRLFPSISIRFPPEIHDRVKDSAAASRRSLNMEVVTLVEEALKEREAKKLKSPR
jgi:predicted HicB family RNase H-like nuclease